MQKQNERLVKKAIKGSKNAFEKLVQQHYERIYRTAYLYVHNEEDALDAVQEAAYQAYKSIHSLKHPEYFLTWLTRIVIRCAVDVIRKRGKVVPMNDDYLSNVPDESTPDIEGSSQLLHAIGQLKVNHRTAIILFYYHDYSIKTISTVMDIPENTVKTYLSRGKAELKKVYEKEEERSHG
ncbi:sigma-70 family RNA polymerase sigma factor [Bacillus sp. Marseille-Q1617]|uniref:sigma-70 family RNA polymerase sigma factor n=1 Tax=Bacillus sp. Marseille-Q1617 TaxID=2736887 RepID=UPI001589F14B|nr:sigma-70 family RNA polymerase sigma factor [Bacillus sp. Marseille-Q1617]